MHVGLSLYGFDERIKDTTEYGQRLEVWLRGDELWQKALLGGLKLIYFFVFREMGAATFAFHNFL